MTSSSSGHSQLVPNPPQSKIALQCIETCLRMHALQAAAESVCWACRPGVEPASPPGPGCHVQGRPSWAEQRAAAPGQPAGPERPADGEAICCLIAGELSATPDMSLADWSSLRQCQRNSSSEMLHLASQQGPDQPADGAPLHVSRWCCCCATVACIWRHTVIVPWHRPSRGCVCVVGMSGHMRLLSALAAAPPVCLCLCWSLLALCRLSCCR